MVARATIKDYLCGMVSTIISEVHPFTTRGEP